MRGAAYFTACLVVCVPFVLFSQSTNTYNVDFIDSNKLKIWMSTAGMTSHNPFTHSPGLEYPKGSNTFVMNIEGLIWGGLINSKMHIGGSTHRYGLQAGPIISYGNAADPTDPYYRLYKIKDIRRQEFELLSADEQQRLYNDYVNWPVSIGAPWIDVDKNGVYEPDFDQWLDGTTLSDYPDVPGVETMWWVSNDLDDFLTHRVYGTAPIGIELQCTFWASNNPGALENTVFMKYFFINKSIEVVNDMYFAKWADADIGDNMDDLAGFSETQQLGYCYNGADVDAVYGNRPPAVGHILVQGPTVPSPGDYATRGGVLIENHKNLPVHAFMVYDTSQLLGDDINNTEYSYLNPYEHLKGYVAPMIQLMNPLTYDLSTTMFSGDPLTGTGWIDGIYRAPGERKYMMSTGPFDLAPGDTQEVIFAITAAQGSDRMNSVALLLNNSLSILRSWKAGIPLSAQNATHVPQTARIASVYPNPVSGNTTLALVAMPHRDNVVMTLTNALGQTVRNVYEGHLSTGETSINIATHGLSSGAYYLLLRTSTRTITFQINIM